MLDVLCLRSSNTAMSCITNINKNDSKHIRKLMFHLVLVLISLSITNLTWKILYWKLFARLLDRNIAEINMLNRLKAVMQWLPHTTCTTAILCTRFKMRLYFKNDECTFFNLYAIPYSTMYNNKRYFSILKRFEKGIDVRDSLLWAFMCLWIQPRGPSHLWRMNLEAAGSAFSRRRHV